MRGGGGVSCQTQLNPDGASPQLPGASIETRRKFTKKMSVGEVRVIYRDATEEDMPALLWLVQVSIL